MAKAIPEGLHSVTPQLSLDGANEAIELYKKAFGAQEVMRAPGPSGKIMHAVVRIGNSQIFVNDMTEISAKPNQSRFWIYLEGVDAAFKRAVDAGCQVRMPLADMFWGDRCGIVADRWGIEWAIAQHMKDLTPEQTRKAEAEFLASQKR